MGEEPPFQQFVLGQLDRHMPHTMYKNYRKGLKDLRTETIKHLEENGGVYPHDAGFGSGF